MLETLTAGFKRARERLAGVQTLTDANLEEALPIGKAVGTKV